LRCRDHEQHADRDAEDEAPTSSTIGFSNAQRRSMFGRFGRRWMLGSTPS
jgi:hypothetical protein